jgi:hypothetical protein
MRTTISALAIGTLSLALAAPVAAAPPAPAAPAERFPFERSWRLVRVLDGGEVVRLKAPDIAVLFVYPPIFGGSAYEANVCHEFIGPATASKDGSFSMTRSTVWKQRCTPDLQAAGRAFRKLIGTDATWRVVDGRLVLRAAGVRAAFVPYHGPTRIAGDKIVVHRKAGTAERYFIVGDGNGVPAAGVDWWYRPRPSARWDWSPAYEPRPGTAPMTAGVMRNGPPGRVLVGGFAPDGTAKVEYRRADAAPAILTLLHRKGRVIFYGMVLPDAVGTTLHALDSAGKTLARCTVEELGDAAPVCVKG